MTSETRTSETRCCDFPLEIALFWRKLAVMLWGYLSSLWRGPYGEKLGPLLIIRTTLSSMYMSNLGSGFTSPSHLKAEALTKILTQPYAAAAAKSLQLCPTPSNPIRRQPTRLPRPWDSPGKNTGVDCHFRLQCMKLKSESEVAQSCPTLSDPMDCRLPGSSIHGIFQARVLEWGVIAFSATLWERLQVRATS